MTRQPLAPVHILAAAVLVALGVVASMLVFASAPNWMGLRWGFDAEAGGAVVRHAEGPAAGIPAGAVFTGISGGGERLDFVAEDFVIEPDGALGRFEDYRRFLARQEQLARIQNAERVTLHDISGGALELQPRETRPLTSFPPDFWVQLAVGVIAWLVSVSIWAFRRSDTGARYLLLSGAATLTFAPFAAVYSTRELALPGTLFRWLNDLNFLGGSLFGAALAALLLYYPRRLAPSWVGWTIVGVTLAWYAAQQLGAFDSMVLARRLLVMITVASTFVLAGVHWRLTRKDPVARAALQWFLLSWLLGVSVFAIGVLLPQMFGIDTSPLQGYGFLLFLLVYGGLAFGVLRFRLFELGEWWARAVAWAASLLLLVVLDLLFLLVLELSSGLSLGLALLITGLAWLPLRAWLWGRIFPTGPVSERAAFQRVVEVALTRQPHEQPQRWTELLREVFDPLRIEPVQTGPEGGASLEQDGLVLVTAGGGSVPPMRLECARGGRRLFNLRDLALADELVGMLRHVVEGKHAYETGVVFERRRIARDVHDNLGAQLLNALHSEAPDRKDRMIREALADLRGIINDAADPGSLEEALADLRHETAERLSANHIALDWPLEEGEADEAPTGLVHTLRSIVREAVSNVIKHAGATEVRISIRLADGLLQATIEDDGVGFAAREATSGRGLANMRNRAESLGGAVSWSAGRAGRGARVEIELPLHPAVALPA